MSFSKSTSIITHPLATSYSQLQQDQKSKDKVSIPRRCPLLYPIINRPTNSGVVKNMTIYKTKTLFIHLYYPDCH